MKKGRWGNYEKGNKGKKSEHCNIKECKKEKDKERQIYSFSVLEDNYSLSLIP